MNDEFTLFGVAEFEGLRKLCGAVFDNNNCRVRNFADGEAQTGKRKKIDGLIGKDHGQNREQDTQHENDDRTDGSTNVPEKQNRDQADDSQFGNEG